MSEHLIPSQPKHHDPGMSSLIDHLQSSGDDAASAEADPATPEPIEDGESEPIEEPEENAPLAAEAEGEEYDNDPLVAVRVNGIEQEIPLSELTQGYSRNADYTRKTQALAEERKLIESERSQLMLANRESIERAASLAQQLQHEMTSRQPSQQELEQLRVSDPGEYAARMADDQRRMSLLNEARAQASAYQSQQHSERVVNERQALGDKEPAFSGEKFESTYAALGQWVTDPNGGGVPVDEWNREADHRRILIAYRAWKGTEQNAAATDRTTAVRKKVANLPRIRSGARHEPGQTEREGYATTLNQMKETGTTRDTARALEAFMSLKQKKGNGNGYS